MLHERCRATATLRYGQVLMGAVGRELAHKVVHGESVNMIDIDEVGTMKLVDVDILTGHRRDLFASESAWVNRDEMQRRPRGIAERFIRFCERRGEFDCGTLQTPNVIAERPVRL